MVNSVVEGSLAMGPLLTAFLLSYWTMRAFTPKAALIRAVDGSQRRKRAQ